KALAIVAAKAYANFRPAGVKVHAGAPILELGMVENDFAEMAAAGVRLVGEIGLGSVRAGKDAAPSGRWGQTHRRTGRVHTGGRAAGKPARVYRPGVGTLAEGREADLAVCGAPTGSRGRDAPSARAAGALPGISMVLIAGKVTIGRSRNTPRAARAAEVVKGH